MVGPIIFSDQSILHLDISSWIGQCLFPPHLHTLSPHSCHPQKSLLTMNAREELRKRRDAAKKAGEKGGKDLAEEEVEDEEEEGGEGGITPEQLVDVLSALAEHKGRLGLPVSWWPSVQKVCNRGEGTGQVLRC